MIDSLPDRAIDSPNPGPATRGNAGVDGFHQVVHVVGEEAFEVDVVPAWCVGAVGVSYLSCIVVAW